MSWLRQLVLALCVADTASRVPETTFALWPERPAPGARGDGSRHTPTLTPFWPPGATAIKLAVPWPAMVILPGGGYKKLSAREGPAYARWLQSHGVACFVLKYRLGSTGYRHPSMLLDVARAVRTVRSNARAWGVDPERIGVMGSSAGGHLASTLAVRFDGGDPTAADAVERVSSRPDIAVLCYPVITMFKNLTHAGSRRNLLGDNPPLSLVQELSNELHVRRDSPPCFIEHTWQDSVVKVDNTLLFASALRAKGVEADVHIFERGPHGMGLGSKDPKRMHPWTSSLLFWLRGHNFVAWPKGSPEQVFFK